MHYEGRLENIYIYIVCDSRCAACEGPSNSDCTMCSSDLGVEQLADQSCVCQYGFYFTLHPILPQQYCLRIYIYIYK